LFFCLVSAGNRNNNDGAINNAGSNGNYWSSSVNGVNARNLNFNSGNAGTNNTNRANGLSVRCLEDEWGTFLPLPGGKGFLLPVSQHSSRHRARRVVLGIVAGKPLPQKTTPAGGGAIFFPCVPIGCGSGPRLWERLSAAIKSPEVTLERPHSNSLRQGRQSMVGQYYLLTTTTAGRSPVFADFRAARCCIEAMRFQQQIGRVASLAFVIMPDHVHWLIALKRDNLAKVMQSVKGYTARRINEIAGRSGPLWQEGYHDRALRADEDVRQTARYIVANSLRAGLVERVWDYSHWDAVWGD